MKRASGNKIQVDFEVGHSLLGLAVHPHLQVALPELVLVHFQGELVVNLPLSGDILTVNESPGWASFAGNGRSKSGLIAKVGLAVFCLFG